MSKVFKLRASAAGSFMSKKDVTLTMRGTIEAWLLQTFAGKKTFHGNKYTRKGTENEEEAINFLNNIWFTDYEKNTRSFEDEYFSGTPDIIGANYIIDIKSSFSLGTFPMMTSAIPDAAYVAQLQVYMHLTGRKKAKVVYVLTNTPEDMIESEAYSHARALGTPLTREVYEMVRGLHVHDNLPDELRVKEYNVDYDPSIIRHLKSKVLAARDLLTTDPEYIRFLSFF
jgi:hypothetical protein